MDIKKLSFSDLYSAHKMATEYQGEENPDLFGGATKDEFVEAIRKDFIRRQKSILENNEPRKDPEEARKKREFEELCTNILKYFDHLKLKYKIGRGNRPLKLTWERKKAIKGIFDKGYTKKDIQLVMQIKFTDWAPKEDCHTYLTPETLFRPSNFSKYLSQADIVIGKMSKKQQNWTD